MGTLLTQFVLYEATVKPMLLYQKQNMYCDNHGFFGHASQLNWTLNEGQAQADLLKGFLHVLNTIACSINIEKIEGHVEDYKHRELMMV